MFLFRISAYGPHLSELRRPAGAPGERARLSLLALEMPRVSAGRGPREACRNELALWVGGELAISTPLFGLPAAMEGSTGSATALVSSQGFDNTRKPIGSACREPLIEPGRAARPLPRKPYAYAHAAILRISTDLLPFDARFPNPLDVCHGDRVGGHGDVGCAGRGADGLRYSWPRPRLDVQHA